MARYLIRISGSIGVQDVEISHTFPNDDRAFDYVRRSLPHYWPAFYQATVYKMDGDQGVILKSFHSKIAVAEV